MRTIRWRFVILWILLSAALAIITASVIPETTQSIAALLVMLGVVIMAAMNIAKILDEKVFAPSVSPRLQPPGNVNQLKAQCAKQRTFRMADLVGPGRRFSQNLYVPRQGSIEQFRLFQQSNARCFTILGESGVGKSNVLIALADLTPEGIGSLFYEGVHLKSGLTAVLKDDLPWAFKDSSDVLEAGKIIGDVCRKFHQRLFIFIDALDDVPADKREDVIDVIRKLSGHDIRFVVSCKDVVWPNFVRRDGSSTALSSLVYPPAKSDSELPGWKLSRCTIDELDAAWEKYASAYKLTGERSHVFNEEASLLYMLRLMAETFAGREIPHSLDSLSLFDQYWARKQQEVGDPLTSLLIVRRLAKSLLESGMSDIEEAQLGIGDWNPVWRASYEALCREHVISMRDDAHSRTVRFHHEKFRSYAVAVLEGQWSDRKKWPEQNLIDHWLQTGSDNPILLSAVDYFVRAVDSGDTPLLSKLFIKDLQEFARLIPSSNSFRRYRSSSREMNENEEARIIRRFEQRAICLDSLLNHHFPHLSSEKITNRRPRIGCVLYINSTGVLWGYRSIRGENSEVVVVDNVLPGPRFENWARYDMHMTRSQGWHDLLEVPPQHLAFEDIKDDLERALRHRDWIFDRKSSSLYEFQTYEVCYERAWHLLYKARVPIDYYRHTGEGLYRLLGFATTDNVETAPVRDLIDRVLYRMLWQQTQHDMLIPVEETRHGNSVSQVLAYPPNDSVTEATNRTWAAQRFSIDEYRFSGDTENKLKDLYHCLEGLSSSREYLHQPLLPELLDDGELWLKVPTEHTVDFVKQLIPLVLNAYRSMVKVNFPTLAPKFWLYRQGSVFTYAEVTANGRGLSVVYAFLEPVDELTEQFGNSYVHAGRTNLPWEAHDTQLTLQLEETRFEGTAYIYHCHEDTIRDQVYELISQDVKVALFGLGNELWL